MSWTWKGGSITKERKKETIHVLNRKVARIGKRKLSSENNEWDTIRRKDEHDTPGTIVLSPSCVISRSHTVKSSSKACRTTAKDATIHAPTCILPARMASVPSALSLRVQRTNHNFRTLYKRRNVKGTIMTTITVRSCSHCEHKVTKAGDMGVERSMKERHRGDGRLPTRRERAIRISLSHCKTAIRLLDILYVVSSEE